LQTHIKWDYIGKKVHLFVPSYIEKALKRFQHPPPIVPQDQPHEHVKKPYGEKNPNGKPTQHLPTSQ
jgi:hypothetical protein